MDFYFNDEVQRIIMQAKKEMSLLKHPYVGSEHLFLALLHLNLEIAQLLNSYGVTYESFRNELIHIVGIGSKKSNWFLFTPLLKQILSQASCFANQKNKLVTPFDLFISILQVGDGVANRILIGMNVDLESLKKNINVSFNEKISLSLLNELGINMNEKSLSNEYNLVVGRDKQIFQIIQNLLRKNKNNLLLIGEAGVGKTAIVEELARRIALGNVPAKLKNKIIYNISMSNIVAGTKYRGEFEEKLHKLIQEVISNPNIILFVDEIHTLMGAGGAEGAIDASNIMKPYLARGDITVIGATTLKEYIGSIKKDKAFDRRFQKIYIQEATREEVEHILKELRPIYEDFHHVLLSNQIISSIVDLSFSNLFVGKQPDQTIDFLDEVCSYVVLYKNKRNLLYASYHKKIEELKQLKKKEILKKNFGQAIVYQEQEKLLQSHYNTLSFQKVFSKVSVLMEDLYNTIYQMVGFPSKKEWNQKLRELNKLLRKEMIGQEEIIEKVISALKKYDYIQNKDCLTFLLVGKSGTGKTFFIDNVVKCLFDENSVISLNMAEYKDRYSLSRLIGVSSNSPYYDNSFVFQSIYENPFSIILLDRIEEAHPTILKQLLTAFSTGYIMTSSFERINLSKCIVFMTTNVCSQKLGFVDEKKFVSSPLYRFIKYVCYFSDVDDVMIGIYLKRRLLGLNSTLKRKIINGVLETDWRSGGFHAVCDYLEKEMV